MSAARRVAGAHGAKWPGPAAKSSLRPRPGPSIPAALPARTRHLPPDETSVPAGGKHRAAADDL